MAKCAFCPNTGPLHEVEQPHIKVCTKCRDKWGTHIVVVCTGCDTLYWLPKSPGNIQMASALSDLPLDHIMENYLLHEIKHCQKCPPAALDLVTTGWVQ